MSVNLKDEIKQGKPFTGPEQEAMLNAVRTAAVLSHELAETLKPYGLTPTQYNVLRILRGAEPKGLYRNDVRDRLLTQMPDSTRLLDRLAKIGLVARVRETDDRRYVTTRITERGLKILSDLDEPIAELHRRQLGHMSENELRTLITLLTKARRRG